MIILLKLNSKGILFLILFTSLFGLNAETTKHIKTENVSSLYDLLGDSPRKHNSQKFKSYFRKTNLFAIKDTSGCSLVEVEKFESISYFGIQCNGNLRKGLLRFSVNRNGSSLPVGYFRLVGYHNIGNKKYIEIKANFSQINLDNNNPRKDETEFNYQQKNNSLKSPTNKKMESIVNPNLTYFKTIAYDKNRRKESPSGLEIFFDDTCPLIFREVDHSFYWDNTVSYVFEISCVKNTPYAIVKVPGNKQGKLSVSDYIGKVPTKGERFLGKLRMRKITNEHAIWENFKLYYE